MPIQNDDVLEVNWPEFHERARSCELLVVAAGFEDRALNALDHLKGAKLKRLAIIRYISGPSDNDVAFKAAQERSGAFESVKILDFDVNQPQRFENEFKKMAPLASGLERGEVWIDVSGLVSHGICMLLKGVRDRFPLAKIVIFYTEANEYYPTFAEYKRHSEKLGGKGLERLPSALTTETRENLILNSFAGFTIRQEKTCLFLFAGYEKHRSLGAIDAINPSKLVIIYGVPGRRDLDWRCELSSELHQNLVTEVERAEERVSTLQVKESINLIASYYDMLYDNYSICVAPLNSKMQTVACFLAWERFQDIQISFALPIGYLPERYSRGAGTVYSYELPMPMGVNLIYGINGAEKGHG